jgi:biopolymer transport protein ExbD
MRTKKKTNLIPLLALMLVMGVFLFTGTAYAASDPEANDLPAEEITALMQTLSVDGVWLTGDNLHIIVTDMDSRESQTITLTLSDYAKPGDEYVTIQATDGYGRISEPIQFKNPYYVPPQNNENPSDTNGGNHETIPDGTRPFTPDGTGTVVDNATDGDGKEFFTVETPDGNVFYLIVDRQRNTDNVYLLNAVTEYDLASLAKEGDGRPASAAPTTPAVTPTPEPPPATNEPSEPAPAPAANNSDTVTIIFVVIAVLAVGGAGYYFKIVRPKQSGNIYDDEPDEDIDEDEEYDVTDSDAEEDEDE